MCPTSAEERTGDKSGHVVELPTYPIALVEVRLYDVKVSRLVPEEPQAAEPEPSLLTAFDSRILSPKELICHLSVSIKAPSEANPEVTIDYALEGFFRATEHIAEEDMTRFAETTAVVLLWPYAREYFSDLTSRLQLTLPRFPTLDSRRAIDMLERAKGLRDGEQSDTPSPDSSQAVRAS